MLKLEDITKNAAVSGIEPGQVVRIVTTEAVGPDALTVYYKTSDGSLRERMLFRADEATLALAEAGRPWGFDSPGEAFKLATEAYRINLAHLFDPMMAVHTSNVEPLPHQITAVYESMLPRQPLRYVLADDPGAGKTIMAGLLIRDGSKMSVKTALQLINRFLAEDDFDHDTQFCLAWFEQQGWATGKFGEGDALARAKGTSVSGLADAGVLESSGGNLRLLRWAELDAGCSPEDDARTPVWEALHQLIRALNKDGESAAGALLARMPARAEPMRALAYRLYTLWERQGWAEDARAYNELVSAWTSIESAATEAGPVGQQTHLDI